MKPAHHYLIRLSATVVVVLLALGLGWSSPAAPAKDDDKTAAAPATNAAPREVIIPQSIFEITNSGTKDPFFPLSIRRNAASPTNAVPTFSASSFVLNGLSGSLKKRLAVINNQTMAPGEEATVRTPAGKVKIRCLTIKENSVIIHVQNQPDDIELRIRKNF